MWDNWLFADQLLQRHLFLSHGHASRLLSVSNAVKSFLVLVLDLLLQTAGCAAFNGIVTAWEHCDWVWLVGTRNEHCGTVEFHQGLHNHDSILCCISILRKLVSLELLIHFGIAISACNPASRQQCGDAVPACTLLSS